MMCPYRYRYAPAIATFAISVLAGTAAAQQVNPAPLTAALAAAPGTVGWRVESLADGRIAAIGADAISGPMRVIGIACGASKRPEIVAAVRGGASLPRSLLVETEDSIMAFPIEASGPAASNPDALVADLSFDPKLKMWLDREPFPVVGAKAALAEVEKDCKRRFGWEYSNDHDKQLVWIFSLGGDPPKLVFGKPSSGWVEAALSCDRAKAVIVRSTALPPRTKSGQSMTLAMQAGDWKLSAAARAEVFKEGDVAGFVVARLGQPGPLFDALASGQPLTLRAGSKSQTIPGRGADALLPRFRAACNL